MMNPLDTLSDVKILLYALKDQAQQYKARGSLIHKKLVTTPGSKASLALNKEKLPEKISSSDDKFFNEFTGEQSMVTPKLPKKVLPLVDAHLPNPMQLHGQAGLDFIQHKLGDCKRCDLCKERNTIVFGQGNPNASLVFVGEGPGADEDKTGLPFVGAAGKLLDRMIIAMGIKREDVYICNVVKCRPPGNRVPEPEEAATCGQFLQAQLQAISPKVIVLLGRTPMQYLLQTSAPMSQLRGQFHRWQNIPVMVTYHPAYLLRAPSAKRQVWEDLQQVMTMLGLPLIPESKQ